MTPEQLIADICRYCKIPFTVGDLDDLLILCQQYHLRVNEITRP